MTKESFRDPSVETVFRALPPSVSQPLLALRALIFETARETDGVGDLLEGLKWGQPAYRPARPMIGTTLRIDALKGRPNSYALFVHCRTSLADVYRSLYPNIFRFDGDRALVFSAGDPVPREALKHCIALALTYRGRPRANRS